MTNVTKIKWLSFFVSWVVLSSAVANVLGIDLIKPKTPVKRTYPAVIVSPDQIYDGDTITGVFVKVSDSDTPYGEIWPGIIKKESGIFVSFNLRIAGIDTPEKHPRKAGRTPESLAAEKKAALAARDYLAAVLKTSGYAFDVVNPKIGKYAGRYVADLEVEGVNVGQMMLGAGYARPYDGGTKPSFDEWYKED